MHHFPLMHLIASQPGGSAPLPSHQLYLLGGIVLGAAMLLVILLVSWVFYTVMTSMDAREGRK